MDAIAELSAFNDYLININKIDSKQFKGLAESKTDAELADMFLTGVVDISNVLPYLALERAKTIASMMDSSIIS